VTSAQAEAPPPEIDTPLREAKAPLPARSRRGRAAQIARLAALGAAIGATISIAVPVAQVSRATARARACVASYEAPRGPALPDCTREVAGFVSPAHVPWTRHAATYRAEELMARAAIAEYVDALVGRPDAARIAPGAEAVLGGEKRLANGSRRLALEELGRAAGAPDLGRTAELHGDRRTLLARFDQWPYWSVRVRAIDAALIEGDPARALTIARRYAEFDPHDQDLRTAVAGTLCLAGGAADARRALELYVTVQEERAAERHEGWARHWGEVRAAILACASRAGLPLPKKPERANAGIPDRDEARAAQRIRITSRVTDDGGAALRESAVAVIDLLRKGPRSPGARVRILGALLASKHAIDASLAAALATPHTEEGEAPLTPPLASMATAEDWIEERRGFFPAVGGKTLARSADRLLELARDPALSPDEARTLRAAAGATALAAARAFANEGDGASAASALDGSGAIALPAPAPRALAKALAWYVAGDRARALSELDAAGAPDMDPVTRVVHDGAASGPIPRALTRAASLLLRAELLASLGRRDEAAAIAVQADEAAAASGVRSLDVHARWVRLALAGDRGLRPASPPPLNPAAPRAWPWIGVAATSDSWLDESAEGVVRLEQALAFWDGARRASPEDRRAIRYAMMVQHRGDAPRPLAAYLALAGDLLPAGDGDVEIWLDAVSAIEGRRVTLRAYAWARAEAALLRGDAARAARWDERRRALVKLAAADEERLELAMTLGL
jgi:hypothetical protein